MESGECVKTFEGHTSHVYSAAFSPDGKYLASVSKDHIIELRKWLSLQELIEDTREKFYNNPLTEKERKEFYLE